MSFGNFEDMNPKEFPKMDELAKNNLGVKDKKLAMFKNKVRWCANFHNYVNEAKVSSIAELACNKHYQTGPFFSAMDKIVSDYDKFPSFKVISEITNSYTKSSTSSVIDPEQWAYQQKELREYINIKKEFINLLGEDKLEKFTHWWLKNSYPELTGAMLNSMNMNAGYFERCALFDWRDTGRTDKFERIIVTSKKKMELLLIRNVKRPRAYERIKL